MSHDTLYDDLKEAMEGLQSIRQIIAGCGHRNQHYIDRQVDKINIVRLKLGLNPIIAPTNTDDGFNGLSKYRIH